MLILLAKETSVFSRSPLIDDDPPPELARVFEVFLGHGIFGGRHSVMEDHRLAYVDDEPGRVDLGGQLRRFVDERPGSQASAADGRA
jgi:hypothetical protein